MRIVGKFKEKDILLESLHMGKTYGDFLLGPSRRWLEEASNNILKDLAGKECSRLFGDDHLPLVVLPEKVDLKELLPDVKVFVRLMCKEPVRGASPHDYFSELILIWFQDGSNDPFDKLIELLMVVDWDAKAEHFYWANL